MKTVKLINLILVLSMVILGIAGCKSTATTEPMVEPTKETVVEPTKEVVVEPTAEPVVEPTAEPVAEPVVIRYANWNLGTEEENNMQRQLIAAYTALYPNVTIEIVDMSDPDGKGWDALLTALAAKGELPDVFQANNVPLYVKNGWLADLSDLTAADADWQNVPLALKNGVTYGGEVLGLPAAQYVMGYFVNRDLYEAANLDAPEYGISVEDFTAAVIAMHDPAKGMLGLDEMEFMMGWYANTQDPNLRWFSFDGAHMNYNSDAFKAAITFAGEMKQYTWQGLTDEQKANFTSVGPWELFTNQEVGMRWDGGWMIPNFAQSATFEWDFIGIPGGNQALVMDVIVVSQTSANTAAAFDFAKWMTFSSQAYQTEADLALAMGSAPKMPVSIDAASIELYKSFFDNPGIIAALENLDNSLIESLAKIIPGYINARWEGKPGIDIGDDKDVNMWFMFNFANDGRYKYEDYAAQLEEFANRILDEALAELNP